MSEYFDLKFIEEPLQDFKEVCLYSCSKDGGIRDFKIFRTYYLLKLWKIELKAYRRLKIQCQNCGKTSYLPQSIAKNIFKNGLNSRLLLKFSNDRILNSWSLNFIAKLWILLGLILVTYSIFIGIRFYSEPVLIGSPTEISYSDLQGNTYQGKIVKVKGKVDYTLAYTKDEIETNPKGNIILKSQEAYLPLFSDNDQLNFVVIRGGKIELANIQSNIGTTKTENLKNQDYEVIGRVELISNIKNEELRQYYMKDLPSDKNLNPPQVLINSADLVDINTFINRYSTLFIVLLILTILSVGIEFYIDIKIREKKNLSV